jgi:hypothetical protein
MKFATSYKRPTTASTEFTQALTSSDYTGQVVILNEGRSWTDDRLRQHQ